MTKLYEFFETHDWCQGAFAKNREGKKLAKGTSPGACCWCLSGAIDVCYESKYICHTATDAFRKLSDTTGQYPSMWNDKPGRTKQEVIELCKQLDI